MRFEAIMNNDFKVQQQENQVLPCQIVVSKPEQLVCTTEVSIPNEAVNFDPTVFTTTLHEVTLLVVALTRFGNLVLPLVSPKPKKKLKSKSQSKADKKS
jgi:hypothetical protein